MSEKEKEKEEEEERRDWLELPAELIHVIAKKLPDVLDFIRFRAVCKAWRSSAPLSDPPDQLPWLLELFEEVFVYSRLRERQRFYSVSSGETLTIPLTNRAPRLDNWIKRGVCGHCLAFADSSERTVSFYNPLTRDLFSPPPTPLEIRYPSTVWTGTDPIRNRCIVFLNHDLFLQNESGKWAFYDPRNNGWVEVEGSFKGTCYVQGTLLVTYMWGPTFVFDAHSKQLLHTVPPPESEVVKDRCDLNDLARHLKESYLIVSSGAILRVSWFHDEDRKTVEESEFHIHRLECETLDGEPFWVRIADIGDQILFLEEMNGFSMTARPSTGYRQGCIYFINHHENQPYMHDISSGTVERVPCPFQKCTWFVPGL